jgi:hypothetical protein
MIFRWWCFLHLRVKIIYIILGSKDHHAAVFLHFSIQACINLSIIFPRFLNSIYIIISILVIYSVWLRHLLFGQYKFWRAFLVLIWLLLLLLIGNNIDTVLYSINISHISSKRPRVVNFHIHKRLKNNKSQTVLLLWIWNKGDCSL